jgi:hypothetical protein
MRRFAIDSPLAPGVYCCFAADPLVSPAKAGFHVAIARSVRDSE